jgi:hemoglobin
VTATEEPSLYERVGGDAFFERLIGAFYDRVEQDPIVRSLYPDQVDFGPARWRLTAFFIQYWGGPTTYSDQRGHPRLRMRHAPFVIGDRERRHWLLAMEGALDELDASGELGPGVRDELWRYCQMAALHMVNQVDERPGTIQLPLDP